MPGLSDLLSERRRCGARTRHGGERRCRAYPRVGKTRCHKHGGASTGPITKRKGWPAYAIAAQKLKWRGARRIKGRRKHEPIEISRARAGIMKELEAAKGNKIADLMEELRLRSLETYLHVLNLPNDLEALGNDQLAHHRRVSLQLSAAHGFTSNQIKVDDSALRAQQHEDWLDAFNKKLAEAEAKLLEKQKK